ncbi:MAG: hypothetical protein KC731_12500, partial [Myxococcales bacterium]|nr:hypothetical protein [Myxococcales bacterium]
IAPACDALATLPLVPRWMPGASWVVRTTAQAAGAMYLGRHRRLLASRRDGEPLAMVEGLARGAAVSPSLIYGLNAFELESAHIGYRTGCTSLGLTGDHTRDGLPRLVYNHDFPPAFEPFLCLRKSRPSRGLAALAVTYPTLVGAIAGVNEAGLAISYNQAYATDLERGRPATFVTFAVQECLDGCHDVEEAVAHLLSLEVASGAMVTLVDAAGGRAVVELSGTQRQRRDPDGSILYTFNKYRLPTMTPVEIPVGAITTGLAAGYDVHRCNLTRQARFLALDHPRRDDASLLQLMADHEDGAGSEDTICRHDDPLSETIMTAIINPVERSMSVLFGRPCREQPTRYTLTEATSVAA